MVKPRKIKWLVHGPTTKNKATSVPWISPNAPTGPQDLMTQSSPEQRNFPPLCFPVSFLPIHPTSLITALQAPILALLIHTKNHIFHIHSVPGGRQQTLFFLTEVLTWAMFSTEKALDKYLNYLKCFNLFWDTSVLNSRAVIRFHILLLQMLQTMGNLW